jgi:hypothetical protein
VPKFGALRNKNMVAITMACKIRDYINDLQKRGILTFTLSEVRQKFPLSSEIAIKSALRRASDDNSVISARQGFYVIVPVSYALRGTVPPELYIDDLMRRLRYSYYVGLLNAAAYYGAAHQQPQEFSVIAASPPLRAVVKKGIRINFIAVRKEIPQSWLRPFRTERGDIQVSKPELTAADLITYQKKIGGFNRVATILYELAEALDFGRLDKQFFDFVPVSTIQRIGYLLDSVLQQPKQAEMLYAKAQAYKCAFQKVPLKRGKEGDYTAVNKRWKIIVNTQLEIDEI